MTSVVVPVVGVVTTGVVTEDDEGVAVAVTHLSPTIKFGGLQVSAVGVVTTGVVGVVVVVLGTQTPFTNSPPGQMPSNTPHLPVTGFISSPLPSHPPVVRVPDTVGRSFPSLSFTPSMAQV